jgi:hypothetical protein
VPGIGIEAQRWREADLRERIAVVALALRPPLAHRGFEARRQSAERQVALPRQLPDRAEREGVDMVGRARLQEQRTGNQRP